MHDSGWINRIYKLVNGTEFCMGGYVDVAAADYWCERFENEEKVRNPGSSVTFEVRREQRHARKPE